MGTAKTVGQRPRIYYDAARVTLDMADRGWNASELARRCEVSAMTISDFLRGTCQTPKIALKIARVFGYKTARRYVSHVEAA